MNKNITFSTIFTLILLSFCSHNQQNKLLKIGCHWAGVDEFYSFVPSYTYKFLSLDQKEQKINEFIERQLIIHDAIKKGYLKNENLQKEIKNTKTKMLIGAYFDKHVTDSIITKDLLLTMYESLDITKREMFIYDEYKPVIKSQLINRYNQDLESTYYQTIAKLKTKYILSANSANIDSLSEKYSNEYRILLSINEKRPSARDVLKRISFDNPIYSVENRSYYLSDLKRALIRYPYSVPNRLSNFSFFANIIENIILNDIIIGIAKQNKYYKEPNFKLDEKIKTGALLYKYYINNKIKSKIHRNNDSLFTFYQQNIDSLYTLEKAYEVHEIYIENKALAEQVLTLAQKTDNYKKLSDKFTERYKNRPKKGYLGFINSDKYSSIGKTAAQTEPGTVYPELIKSGQGYSIIKVLSVREPAPIPFEENTDRIFSDYYTYKFSSLKRELITQLKDTYTYKFDRSKLN